MLVLPQIGFARLVEPEHKVELDALCDWIEASLVFTDAEFVSGSNVVDVLCEEEIYESQEFAWKLVDIAMSELGRRRTCLGIGAPFNIDGDRIVRTRDWHDVAAYSFCLTLACLKWYPKWSSSLVKDYARQGQLFEEVAAGALERLFRGWKVHRTGWSPDNPRKIGRVVSDVAKLLRETQCDLRPWVSKDANEVGLDIVCYRPFDDARPGLPTLLVQCASGKHHEHKLGTPNMKEWEKIILFTAVRPQRSFITPYVFTDEEFRRKSNKVDGLLLDRLRLLSAGNDGEEWLPAKLNERLREWVSPRVAKLERAL